jgi:DNA-binding response OmpR family regulator
MSEPITVAVVNTNDDIVEMLRIVLEQAGFVVVSGHIDAVRRGGLSLQELVSEHNPRVVVYDLVPPYDRSWRFLEHLRAEPGMDGRRFILTSANAAAARELSGGDRDIIEVLGKPYDLDAVVNAVRAAAAKSED